MKFTNYFLHTRQRADRKIIKLEWNEKVCDNPDHQSRQEDGRIRKWGYIPEMGNYLRVVLLEDNETVHNAFFDRDFKQ